MCCLKDNYPDRASVKLKGEAWQKIAPLKSYKKILCSFGELPQWLRTFTALAKDPGLVPCRCVLQLVS